MFFSPKILIGFLPNQKRFAGIWFQLQYKMRWISGPKEESMFCYYLFLSILDLVEAFLPTKSLSAAYFLNHRGFYRKVSTNKKPPQNHPIFGYCTGQSMMISNALIKLVVNITRRLISSKPLGAKILNRGRK